LEIRNLWINFAVDQADPIVPDRLEYGGVVAVTAASVFSDADQIDGHNVTKSAYIKGLVTNM
jgi:hypothetical protein